MPDSAILLIHCPDQPGIVAAVSGFFYQHQANILHADLPSHRRPTSAADPLRGSTTQASRRFFQSGQITCEDHRTNQLLAFAPGWAPANLQK
jgi:formyltetrahydrofolate hydrolase